MPSGLPLLLGSGSGDWAVPRLLNLAAKVTVSGIYLRREGEMSFGTDPNTDIGKVRLLITDLDSTKPIFPDDAQIQAFLDLELGSVRLAAALALEVIAGNRVLTLQVVQLLDLKMDGHSVAKGLLETAKQFRDNAEGDWAGFDFAEQVDNSDFAYRERMIKLLEV